MQTWERQYDALLFHELLDADDPALIGFLRLYETSFPPNERGLTCFLLQLIQKKKRGEETSQRLFAVSEEADPSAVIGICWIEVEKSSSLKPFVVLWYLAVDSSQRSRGYGSRVLNFLSQLCFVDNRYGFIVLEAEEPEQAKRNGDEAEADAYRRLSFYQRNRYQMLTGIVYDQQVAGHDPVRMRLLIQANPQETLSAERIYPRLLKFFGEKALRRQDDVLLKFAPADTGHQ